MYVLEFFKLGLNKLRFLKLFSKLRKLHLLALLSFFVLFIVFLILNKDNLYELAETIQYYYHNNQNEADDHQVEYKNGNRIFCLILTNPNNFNTKAAAVSRTWARECDNHKFISILPNNVTTQRVEANINGLEILKPYGLVKDEYNLLTDKIYLAYIDIYKNYGDNYDWFLKADDDTYVFMDNLRFYLENLNLGKRLFYYGHKFYLGSFNYNSGGAGYVLSRVVLGKMVKKLTSNYSVCPNSGVEDMDVGKLLKNMNIYAKLALDSGKNILFHPFSIKHHLNENSNIFKVYI